MADVPTSNITNVKYEFIEGHFYCDGVKVQASQMTIEEIKKYIPVDFQPAFLSHKQPVKLPTPPHLVPPKTGA